MKILIILLSLVGLAIGQTASPAAPAVPLPATAAFVLAGYGVKVDGSVGYAQLLSQSSGAYSVTYFRFVPVNGKLPLSLPAATTGAALHLRDFSLGAVLLRTFALGQAGAVSSGTSTLFTSAIGGFATIDPKTWKHAGFLVGIDVMKTATGKAYPNCNFGVVIKP